MTPEMYENAVVMKDSKLTLTMASHLLKNIHFNLLLIFFPLVVVTIIYI